MPNQNGYLIPGTDLTILGDAAYSGSTITLTSGTPYQVGGCIIPIEVQTDWKIQFQYRIDQSSDPPADGMAVVFDKTLTLTAGGSLGISGTLGEGWAVCLDTYNNSTITVPVLDIRTGVIDITTSFGETNPVARNSGSSLVAETWLPATVSLINGEIKATFNGISVTGTAPIVTDPTGYYIKIQSATGLFYSRHQIKNVYLYLEPPDLHSVIDVRAVNSGLLPKETVDTYLTPTYTINAFNAGILQAAASDDKKLCFETLIGLLDHAVNELQLIYYDEPLRQFIINYDSTPGIPSVLYEFEVLPEFTARSVYENAQLGVSILTALSYLQDTLPYDNFFLDTRFALQTKLKALLKYLAYFTAQSRDRQSSTCFEIYSYEGGIAAYRNISLKTTYAVAIFLLQYLCIDYDYYLHYELFKILQFITNSPTDSESDYYSFLPDYLEQDTKAWSIIFNVLYYNKLVEEFDTYSNVTLAPFNYLLAYVLNERFPLESSVSTWIDLLKDEYQTVAGTFNSDYAISTAFMGPGSGTSPYLTHTGWYSNNELSSFGFVGRNFRVNVEGAQTYKAIAKQEWRRAWHSGDVWTDQLYEEQINSVIGSIINACAESTLFTIFMLNQFQQSTFLPKSHGQHFEKYTTIYRPKGFGIFVDNLYSLWIYRFLRRTKETKQLVTDLNNLFGIDASIDEWSTVVYDSPQQQWQLEFPTNYANFAGTTEAFTQSSNYFRYLHLGYRPETEFLNDAIYLNDVVYLTEPVHFIKRDYPVLTYIAKIDLDIPCDSPSSVDSLVIYEIAYPYLARLDLTDSGTLNVPGYSDAMNKTISVGVTWELKLVNDLDTYTNVLAPMYSN